MAKDKSKKIVPINRMNKFFSQDEFDLENQAEKDRMVAELKEMGKEVDMRSHKGANGLGSLKAYYEAVIARKGESDGDSE